MLYILYVLCTLHILYIPYDLYILYMLYILYIYVRSVHTVHTVPVCVYIYIYKNQEIHGNKCVLFDAPLAQLKIECESFDAKIKCAEVRKLSAIELESHL